jgi:hypothetical protein
VRGPVEARALFFEMTRQTHCPCGRRLHYEDPRTRAAVERVIEELGERVKVTIAGRSWLVSRHYVMLHRLDFVPEPVSVVEMEDLALRYGFEEVGTDDESGQRGYGISL